MINAMRICDNIEISLSDDFLTSDSPSEVGSGLLASSFEICFDGLDLTQFAELTASIQAEHERYSTAMDAAMAIDLHKALPITRRQASDTRFWAWLGLEYSPDFVAWRWKPSGELPKRSRERFCGNRVRQTFARIWWAAELTRDGDNYDLTTKMVNLPGFQDIYEALFGRAFGNYRPALAAFIDVTGQKSEKFIRDFAKQLGYALTTTTLETMDEMELKGLMNDLAGRLESKAA